MQVLTLALLMCLMAKQKEAVLILRQCKECALSTIYKNELYCTAKLKEPNVYIDYAKTKESKCYYFKAINIKI